MEFEDLITLLYVVKTKNRNSLQLARVSRNMCRSHFHIIVVSFLNSFNATVKHLDLKPAIWKSLLSETTKSME